MTCASIPAAPQRAPFRQLWAGTSLSLPADHDHLRHHQPGLWRTGGHRARRGGGSIANAGLLGAADSVGLFLGAGFAGTRGEGENPTRRHALFGLVAVVALALFATLPVGPVSMVLLAMTGFVAFSEAVWNTSRVRRAVEPAYQGRLQVLTTMTFSEASILGGGCGVVLR